jgi:uncharacterized protein YggE
MVFGAWGIHAVAQQPNRVRVELTEWVVDMPDDLVAGPSIFEITNLGLFTHSLRIEGQNLEAQLDLLLRPRQSGLLEVELLPGTYEVYCPVGNHAQLGMRRTITVTAAEPSDAPAVEDGAADLTMASLNLPPLSFATAPRGEEQMPPTDDGGSVVGNTPRTVTVIGIGQADAVPDQAVIIAGVRTEGDTAAQTLVENSRQMQTVLTTLRDRGIATGDIRTESVQLFPRYEETPPPQTMRELAGYTVVNLMQVRVRSIAGLGELLDEIVQAGANTLQAIRFEVGDSDDLLDRAREAAMQDASQKAARLAALANASLGDVLTINEVTRGPGPLVAEMIARADAAPVPVEPGTQTITVEVQVAWLLR